MTFAFILLAISAVALGAAVAVQRQGPLLLSVTVYCGVTVWLTLEQMSLLLPALIIAIAIESAGVVRLLSQSEAQDETFRHNSTQVMTGNTAAVGPR